MTLPHITIDYIRTARGWRYEVRSHGALVARQYRPHLDAAMQDAEQAARWRGVIEWWDAGMAAVTSALHAAFVSMANAFGSACEAIRASAREIAKVTNVRAMR